MGMEYLPLTKSIQGVGNLKVGVSKGKRLVPSARFQSTDYAARGMHRTEFLYPQLTTQSL